MRRLERQIVRLAEVGDVKVEFVNPFRIVEYFYFRTVVVSLYVRPQIGLRVVDNVFHSRYARALLSRRIRQAVLIVNRTRRTHRKLHCKTVDNHRFPHLIFVGKIFIKFF